MACRRHPERSRGICTHALTHSRTHALTLPRTPAPPGSRAPGLPRSRTHALTHSRTHALTHSRTHALTHSRTHALTTDGQTSANIHSPHRGFFASHTWRPWSMSRWESIVQRSCGKSGRRACSIFTASEWVVKAR